MSTPDPVSHGRQLIGAWVRAEAWRFGWTTRRTAAAKCEINENVYRAIITNDGSYVPHDDSLERICARMLLDRERMARLLLGVFSATGDATLDDHVEQMRSISATQRRLVIELVAAMVAESAART